MARRGWRLVVVGLVLAVLPPAPRGVDAQGVELSICTEQAFDEALNAVQDAAGGTLTITCSGVILFNTQKEITASVKIVGVGTVAFDGQGITRLFWVHPDATLELERLALQNGASSSNGGAIFNDHGTLKITASAFSGNNATNQGGAIYFYGEHSGTVEITASTFSGNRAEDGGAIAMHTGRMEIVASTFSGNRADAFGGAILVTSALPSRTRVMASTFIDNGAPVGGTIHNLHSQMSLRSTILANGFGGHCELGDPTYTYSEGYNLSDDDSCNLAPRRGDIITSTGINLGPLQDNGGPTMTMLPLPGSAAIEAIPPSACATLSSARDQRGLPRPLGQGCEIGAVELQDTVMCASRSTGQLSRSQSNGKCPSTSEPLSLPSPDPLTFCIHPATGALSWSSRGSCAPTLLVHVMPDDGPLAYCEQLLTGKLRYTRTGACSPAERPGVIPSSGL